MLVDVCEWPLSQVKHSLDAKHGQLEVVSVQDIGHVSKVEHVLFDFTGEARSCSHLPKFRPFGCVRRQAEKRILCLEVRVKVFHAERLVNRCHLRRGQSDLLVCLCQCLTNRCSQSIRVFRREHHQDPLEVIGWIV